MDSSIFEQKIIQPQSIVTDKRVLWMGILSIVAAIGCVAADLILQYDPQGNYSLMTPAPINIAPWRVYVGTYLGVFCIPLEIAGYWVVCTILSETMPRIFKPLFWVIAYSIVIGTVFHSMTLAIILVAQSPHNASGVFQTSLLQLQTTLFVFTLPLAIFFELVYLVMWSVVAVIVLRTTTRYPKWIILFIPALGSIVIAGAGQSHIVPVLGNVLYPTVLSLPHLIFFLLSTIVLWRKYIPVRKELR